MIANDVTLYTYMNTRDEMKNTITTIGLITALQKCAKLIPLKFQAMTPK